MLRCPPVSIPHRYSTNLLTPRLGESVAHVSIPHRYSTNLALVDAAEQALVQFRSLIGTLQTHARPKTCRSRQPVSIPHRYSTNAGAVQGKGVCLVVSIPHRYSTNEDFDGMALKTCIRVSIPHRYSTNAVPDSQGAEPQGSFDPS